MSLREASGVVWDTIRDWYHSMIGLAALNLLWISLSLTLVLLPPATAGVFAMTHSIAQGKGQQWPLFWTSARRYGWISARWAALNVTIVILFVVNFTYYGAADTTLGMAVQIALAISGLLWFTVQLYFWPFMLSQDQKQVRVALKNALFLTLAEPLYTSVVLTTTALVLVLSILTVLPIAVFALSFIALLTNQAVIERLTNYGKLPGTGPSPTHGEQ